MNYYDDKDLKTGERKQNWGTVQRHHSRFSHYLELLGITKRNIKKVGEYVFEKFEKGREQQNTSAPT